MIYGPEGSEGLQRGDTDTEPEGTRKPAPRHLEDIPYPAGTGDYLADLDNRVRRLGAEDARAFAETGTFPTFRVPDALMREYLVCLLVDLLNDVVESFNAIVADIEQMPQFMTTLRARPSKRLELLVRGFLSEAYRGREIIFKIAGEMRRRGYVDRQDVKTLRAAFDQRLGPLYSIRHSLQHGDGLMTRGEIYALLKAIESAPQHHEEAIKSLMPRVIQAAYDEKAEAVATAASEFREVFATVVTLLATKAGLAQPEG